MEWKEAGDVVVISGSFTSGTVLSALATAYCGAGDALITAAAAMPVAVAAAIFFAAKGNNRLSAVPLFIALGVLCHSGAVVLGTSQTAGLTSFGPVRAALGKFRDAIADMPFEYRHTAPLLLALLTGGRDRLPSDVTEAFRSSGASHILALSGLHLGIIYGLLSKVLVPLGKSRAAAIVKSAVILTSTGFYALVTGCSPSIIRALLFIWLNELCRFSLAGRRKNPLNIFCSALTIQLVTSPTSISSTGFQLSYLAMSGIFLLYPILQKWYPSSGNRHLDRADPSRRIWNSAAMTLSCQIFTAPLVWMKFRSFPTHFLLTNLLALPLTECLILTSIADIALTRLGICPVIMIKATDQLARCLVFSLQVISSM